MTIEAAPHIDPLQEIAMIRQEIAVMGFNDAEFYNLDRIVADFEAGRITGEEAVAQALRIKFSKQDYH